MPHQETCLQTRNRMHKYRAVSIDRRTQQWKYVYGILRRAFPKIRASVRLAPSRCSLSNVIAETSFKPGGGRKEKHPVVFILTTSINFLQLHRTNADVWNSQRRENRVISYFSTATGSINCGCLTHGMHLLFVYQKGSPQRFLTPQHNSSTAVTS